MNDISKNRLSWYSNEDIFNILNSINDTRLLTNDVCKYPVNGSIFIYDKRKVKNFKKDSYTWKKRKLGGNSIREDRMSLKLNGVECIYGCYSHNALIPAFHRRCYWLLDKSDYVLVHYLIRFNDSSSINKSFLNQCLAFGSSLSNGELSFNDIYEEISSILYPYSTHNDSNRKLIEKFAHNLYDRKNFVINIEIDRNLLSVGKETNALIENDPQNALRLSRNQSLDDDSNYHQIKALTIIPQTKNDENFSLIIKQSTCLCITSSYSRFEDKNTYSLRNIKNYSEFLPLKFINSQTLEYIMTNQNYNYSFINNEYYLFENTFILSDKVFKFDPENNNNNNKIDNSYVNLNLYKYKFFLLERFLHLNSLMQINHHFFYKDNLEESLCSLMNIYVNVLKDSCENLVDLSGTSVNETSLVNTEGKCIAHLIILLQDRKMFDHFCELYEIVQNANLDNSKIKKLKSEFDLLNFDTCGYTPLVSLKIFFGHTF